MINHSFGHAFLLWGYFLMNLFSPPVHRPVFALNNPPPARSPGQWQGLEDANGNQPAAEPYGYLKQRAGKARALGASRRDEAPDRSA